MKQAISVAILSLCLIVLIGCQDEQFSDTMFPNASSRYMKYAPGPEIIVIPDAGGGDLTWEVAEENAFYIAINARGIIEVDGVASKPVDFLVMDVENFNLFKQNADFAFLSEGSELNTAYAQYSFEAGGTFYFVVSNAGGIEGGAVPNGLAELGVTLYGEGELLDGPGIIRIGE